MPEVPKTSSALWPVGPRSLMTDPDAMRKLPSSDPFKNKVAGKAQDRVAPGDPSGPRPDPTFVLMAAAVLHEQGKLFEPNGK